MSQPNAAPNAVEERLFYDLRRPNDLSEVFWCHMGRYVYAFAAVREQAARLARPLRVLDAASGTGYGTFFLSRSGQRCDGLDISAEAVAFSRAVYGRPNCRFTQGTVLELPFEPAAFDVVISFETIEHLEREQQQVFLKEIHRVLKPDGRMLISAPTQQGGASAPAHNQFHLYEPDPGELLGLVQQNFKRIRVLGQLLGPASQAASTPSALQPSATSEQAAQVSLPPSRLPVLRGLRSGGRRLSNVLLGRHYLRRPWLTEQVMSLLYTGYRLQPLDLDTQAATFLVLDASTPRLP